MSKPRRARLDPIDLWLLRHLIDEKGGMLYTPNPDAWKDLVAGDYVRMMMPKDGEGMAHVVANPAGYTRAAP